MRGFRNSLVAVALAAAAIASPARADSAAAPAYVLIIHPNGMTTIGEIGASAAGIVMTHSTPLSEPVILTLSNGKAYLGGKADSKMPDGTSMMDFISSNYCSDAKHPGGCG